MSLLNPGKNLYRETEILVVDDDAGSREELSDVISTLGFVCHQAGDGEAALYNFAQNPDVGVVVTDLCMPGENGLDLVQKISLHAESRRPPETLVVTGFADLDKAIGALRLSVTDFLKKPVSREALVIAVHRAVGRWQSRDRRADFGSHRRSAVQGEATGRFSAAEADTLKRLIDNHVCRERYFDAQLFSDPIWAMLLDLALAEAQGQSVSVTSLCAASGAPYATAFRKLDLLLTRRMISRRRDPKDKRRVIVELTADTREKLKNLVGDIRQQEMMA
ncbi:MAG: response regulator [Alphaproteobacteria bacterium]